MTLVAAGDRLRALEEVAVVYRGDGSAVVENRGRAEVAGLTLSLPVPGAVLEVEGASVRGRRAEDDRSVAWLDLPPGGRVVVRARGTRGALAFASGEAVAVSLPGASR